MRTSRMRPQQSHLNVSFIALCDVASTAAFGRIPFAPAALIAVTPTFFRGLSARIACKREFNTMGSCDTKQWSNVDIEYCSRLNMHKKKSDTHFIHTQSATLFLISEANQS